MSEMTQGEQLLSRPGVLTAAKADWQPPRRYLLAAMGSIATLALSLLLGFAFGDDSVDILYLVPVGISALAGGPAAAALCIAISILFIDFFSMAPVYSLRIADPLNILELVVFVAVGALITIMIEARGRARQREVELARRQLETQRQFDDATIATNDALRERITLQEQLETVSGAAPGVLYTFRMSAEGRFSMPFASAGLQRIFDVAPQDVVSDGRLLVERFHPEDRPALLASIAKSARELGRWEFEGRVTHSTRGEVWLHGYSTPRREADGSTLWHGFLLDVTDHHRAVHALAESETRLGAVVHSAMDAIVAFDDQQRVVLFNPAAERIFALPSATAIGLHLEQFLPESARARHDELFMQSSPDAVRMAALAHPRAVRARRADGTEFDAELTVSATSVNGHRLLTVVVRDITDRERAQVALRQSEERFRELAENIREVFWMATPDHKTLLYVSPAFETVWGRSVASIHANREEWLDSIHVDDRARVVAAMRATLPQGSYEAEYRIERPNGETRWIHDQAFPVRDDTGHIIRIAGIAEDITERRKLEAQVRQTQRLESIGLLAGGVAHDFNNWLTVISGNSELVLSDLEGNDPNRELLEEIVHAGERAASLTRQLLAFSRQQVIEPRTMDLNTIVLDTEKMLRRLIGEDVALVTRLSPSRCPVKLDPGQWVQVLMNLAVNARDAMGRGGRLTIETSVLQADAAFAQAHPPLSAGPVVRLVVRDTGHGMPAGVLSRIFEPFFTTKAAGRGTGLGLAVVHGIVTQAGGHVQVESTPDAGTTFTIALPGATHDRLTPASLAAVPDTTTSGTLLLVEDEPSVRRVAARALLARGYHVIEATDGEDALEALSRASDPHIDLLVTDVVMPKMDGRELTEHLTGRFPGLRVLYTSGYTDDAVVRHGVLHQDVAFLQKPYTPAALVQRVREVLEPA